MNFLFLHGLAGSPDDWDKTGKEIEKYGHFWLAPEIPYLHGNYSTLTELSAVVRESIPDDFLGPGSIVVGNSLGGSMALQVGAESRLIVLVASYTSTSTQWIGRGIDTLDREIDRIFYDTKIIPLEKLQAYRTLWQSLTCDRRSFSRLKKIKLAIERSPLDHLYESLQEKIHAICGAQDNLSPLHNFLTLKNRFPGIALDTIENCGHAIPIEKPIELASILNAKPGVAAC